MDQDFVDIDSEGRWQNLYVVSEVLPYTEHAS